MAHLLSLMWQDDLDNRVLPARPVHEAPSSLGGTMSPEFGHQRKCACVACLSEAGPPVTCLLTLAIAAACLTLGGPESLGARP